MPLSGLGAAGGLADLGPAAAGTFFYTGAGPEVRQGLIFGLACKT
jgi:hypothetical protein